MLLWGTVAAHSACGSVSAVWWPLWDEWHEKGYDEWPRGGQEACVGGAVRIFRSFLSAFPILIIGAVIQHSFLYGGSQITRIKWDYSSPWRSVHKIRLEYMSHIWLWNEISTKLASGITPHTLSAYLQIHFFISRWNQNAILVFLARLSLTLDRQITFFLT